MSARSTFTYACRPVLGADVSCKDGQREMLDQAHEFRMAMHDPDVGQAEAKLRRHSFMHIRRRSS
ncbi:hypothetical protein LP419_03980 [Massilia sp. H-1]|nr:hypothetical protein LP419_03980 [Massilia sp. H-1]